MFYFNGLYSEIEKNFHFFYFYDNLNKTRLRETFAEALVKVHLSLSYIMLMASFWRPPHYVVAQAGLK